VAMNLERNFILYFSHIWINMECQSSKKSEFPVFVQPVIDKFKKSKNGFLLLLTKMSIVSLDFY
jgi:uncharacterized protein Smg (DUF494 family)